jgi:uncharacterized membrane protein YcaP (DUF421 family)
MINKLIEIINRLIGAECTHLTFSMMAVRACIVYSVAVILVRTAKQRLMGKYTALDFVLLLFLGSLFGNAIVNPVPFFTVLAVAFLVAGLHWLFSFITFYSEKAGFILKGSAKVLIENGKVNWENLRASYISYRDLLSALRSNAHVTHPRDVKLAILERNGSISVIVRNNNINRACMRD